MALCHSNYTWADNIQGMDPCDVASSLMHACDNSLPPLIPYYDPEDEDNYYHGVPATRTERSSSCVCSSVIYALVSACSDCQGGKIVSWSTWSLNCTSPSDVPESSDVFAANTSILLPPWAAHFDVRSDPTYSPSAASSSALLAILSSTIARPTTNLPPGALVHAISSSRPATTTILPPKATGPLTPQNAAVLASSTRVIPTKSSSSHALQAISSSTIARPTTNLPLTGPFTSPIPANASQATSTNTLQFTPTKSSLTSLATASFGSNRSSATTGNRTADIAGGTIAAVVVLALGAALAYWYMRRRRRTRVPPSVAYMAVYGQSVY